ncbi:hypothetical protein BHE74_00044364 [Ensete ventricosum]|uniref:Uncharacterized protein n=1 Tax=Ensete ventricosum TaxID=4639 RepID=A0A426Z7J5_ENSVE|nr:hypothetical protein B296_00045373 [Ensete ventricosum]RWW49459.1 hypothetical protein BHE74_00044364 [Ensete ventricosum]RZS17036.1 hypothetical protein BHM03_00049137 [Ensete ventricosum]
MSCAKSNFDWFFAHRLEISKYWTFPTLAHGKSYKHGFVKEHDGHKLCRK